MDDGIITSHSNNLLVCNNDQNLLGDGITEMHIPNDNKKIDGINENSDQQIDNIHCSKTNDSNKEENDGIITGNQNVHDDGLTGQSVPEENVNDI